MEKVTRILSVVVFFVLFQATLAERCRKKKFHLFGSHESTTHIYCPFDCCGSVRDRYCCSHHWSGGTIAGAVIGGIIGLTTLIAIIVAIFKACTRSGNNGLIVQPTQYPQPGVFVVNTSSTQPYPSTTQYGMAPPPYTSPGVAYPPQPGQEPFEFGPGKVG